MISAVGTMSLGNVQVQMTSGRGFTPEELAVRAVDRIVTISASVTPEVRAQAEAYRTQLYNLVLHYLKQAVTSEHTTLANKFIASGHPELIALLKE